MGGSFRATPFLTGGLLKMAEGPIGIAGKFISVVPMKRKVKPEILKQWEDLDVERRKKREAREKRDKMKVMRDKKGRFAKDKEKK